MANNDAINLMIEGQESVTWPQWVALAEAAESAGLQGLFRSDHYASVQGRTERSALDAWSTLAALAALTDTIQLGTMVSPASFRHPSVLAKQVVVADHVSGGRVELGFGAGWNELEHTMYGFDFADLGTRYDVMAEQIENIRRQWTEESVDFDGAHYTLAGCEARPKPLGHVPIIMGGQAQPRGAALAPRRLGTDARAIGSKGRRRRRARGPFGGRDGGRDLPDVWERRPRAAGLPGPVQAGGPARQGFAGGDGAARGAQAAPEAARVLRGDGAEVCIAYIFYIY